MAKHDFEKLGADYQQALADFRQLMAQRRELIETMGGLEAKLTARKEAAVAEATQRVADAQAEAAKYVADTEQNCIRERAAIQEALVNLDKRLASKRGYAKRLAGSLGDAFNSSLTELGPLTAEGSEDGEESAS